MTDDSRRAVVSVAQLNKITADRAPLMVLDVRWQLGGPSQYPAYLAGHLPGAVWCDLDTDLADPPGAGGRHPLPRPDRLQERFSDWGITADAEVVVYDGGPSIAAARAWWVLRWAGLSRVRVLDGGYPAWVEAGLPISTEVSTPAAGTAVVRPGSLPTLDAESAARWAEAGRLVDVRAPERFRGEVEPMDPVAGHIPGAVNVPTTGNVGEDGRFRPVAELAGRFAAVADTGEPVGVYCGSGVTAAHTALALDLAGRSSVLYPGSWSEWVTDPRRPVALG